jgi:hypothetical protein
LPACRTTATWDRRDVKPRRQLGFAQQLEDLDHVAGWSSKGEASAHGAGLPREAECCNADRLDRLARCPTGSGLGEGFVRRLLGSELHRRRFIIRRQPVVGDPHHDDGFVVLRESQHERLTALRAFDRMAFVFGWCVQVRAAVRALEIRHGVFLPCCAAEDDDPSA